MPRRYVYEDGRPGRPKVKVNPISPKDFSRLIDLMTLLDPRGWYVELARRQRRKYLKANPRLYKGRSLRRITDPEEMDRIMCRSEVVAECKTETDLKVARFNGRVVLEIDPACPNELSRTTS